MATDVEGLSQDVRLYIYDRPTVAATCGVFDAVQRWGWRASPYLRYSRWSVWPHTVRISSPPTGSPQVEYSDGSTRSRNCVSHQKLLLGYIHVYVLSPRACT